MRIGIVSENYKHDSEALKLLLNKQFAQQVIFIPILKQVTGDNLLTPKTARLINKYRESDAPKIFQELNFQKVYNTHKGENSFQSFIDELKKIVNKTK